MSDFFPNVILGRKRITKVTDPSESGYVKSITAQTRAIGDQITELIKALQQGSPAALKHAMQPMFDDSQVLVPVDTGRLKRSGFITIEKGFKGGSRVSIGYARGGSPHYGAMVHERVDIQHAGVTQAKFLEEAMKRNMHKVQPRFIAFVRSKTGLGK